LILIVIYLFNLFVVARSSMPLEEVWEQAKSLPRYMQPTKSVSNTTSLDL